MQGIFLYKTYKTDPSLHSVQSVMIPIGKSPRFRVYSSIKVKPGTYTVEIRDLNGNVLTGGKAKRITILEK